MSRSPYIEQLIKRRVTHNTQLPTKSEFFRLYYIYVEMYCLWLVTFLLVPAVVFSQGHLCPNPPSSTTCDILPKHCSNDTTCHVPGERCCPNGCHGPTCLPVVRRMCPVGEALNTTDGPRICSSQTPCPAGFYCHMDRLTSQGACCRNHNLTGCSNKLCGHRQLCYMYQPGLCRSPPCAKTPMCFPHPCKSDTCEPGTKCRLVENTSGPIPVKHACKGSSSGASVRSGSFVMLTMIPIVGGLIATH